METLLFVVCFSLKKIISVFIRPKEELWAGATWQGGASGAGSLVAVSSTRGHPACWGAISPSYPFCYCLNLHLGFSSVCLMHNNKQCLIAWRLQLNLWAGVALILQAFFTGYFTLFSLIKLHLFCIQSMVLFDFQFKWF